MRSDIEIAQAHTMKPIEEIAAKVGLGGDEIQRFGHYKAKVPIDVLSSRPDKAAKLVLVTGISPTPAGEGKSTTSVGLADALTLRERNPVLCLREPSLGPVFGIKGGAAGGGYSQVVPMEDINLHFTGDFHAISSAHGLLSAMLDNHLFRPNTANIDHRRITWRRAVDMNDRALRSIVVGLGGPNGGIPREDGFMITAASEVMAIFCLSRDLTDLEKRLGNIIVGYTRAKEPIRASDIGAQPAMTILLRDAIHPNMVQTLGGTPAFIHGGPFANIAHGCNSLIATRAGLKLGDIVVTEAGFGADLGAEKFFDIKCRMGGLSPEAVVIVATIRALKMHGGVPKDALATENVAALEAGMENLFGHVENVGRFGVPAVVAINRFASDSPAEVETLLSGCAARGIRAVEADPPWRWGRRMPRPGGCGVGDGPFRRGRVQAPLSGRHVPGGEDRNRGDPDLRGQRRRLPIGSPGRAEPARGVRPRQRPGLRGEDPVLLLGQPVSPRAPAGVQHQRAGGDPFGRRRVRGRQDGRHHDHARPGSDACSHEHDH